jgi:hypothetical protein
MSDKTARIRGLNDQLRKTFEGGRIVMTIGVNALEANVKQQVLDRVRAFDAFNNDNDPHGEHDFGSFEIAGDKIFWKIDYYNVTLDGGSEDPSDPTQTTRVLTIMLAEEY